MNVVGRMGLGLVIVVGTTQAKADPSPSKSDGATKAEPGSAFSQARQIRCKTALCYGSDNWLGIEPLIELPVGGTFALIDQNGLIKKDLAPNALGAWIDSHPLTVTLNAGLRVWFFDDLVSLSIYFAQPVVTGSNTLHVQGSPFAYPASNIHRPYPGFAIGLLQDILWIGFDYQQLVNGDSTASADPNYPLNFPVSSAWSMTVGLATATTVRTGIGALAKLKENTTPAAATPTINFNGQEFLADVVTDEVIVNDGTVFHCLPNVPMHIKANKVTLRGSVRFACEIHPGDPPKATVEAGELVRLNKKAPITQSLKGGPDAAPVDGTLTIITSSVVDGPLETGVVVLAQ